MNKLFTKIGTAIVGLAMAVGVGVAVGRDQAKEVKADPQTSSGSKTIKSATDNTGDDAWTMTGASGYYTSSPYGAKLDASGEYVFRNSIFSGDVSSYMTNLVVTVNGKINGTPNNNNSYTVMGIDKDGDETGSVNLTGSDIVGTSADDTEFTIASNLSNTTGIKIVYTTKGAGNWAIVSVSWTATYEVPALGNYVTYNANGGSGTMAKSLIEDGNVTLTKNTFTYSGKYFTGWNTKADGVDGTAYADQAEITGLSDNLTLYAQWADATLQSISVKEGHEPKSSYTIGQCFNPAGLELSLNYDHDAAAGTAVYGTDEGFSFVPSLETALTESNIKVTISYAGKSVDYPITVSESTSFKLIKSSADLVAGAKYVIGATYSDADSFISTTQNGNNRGKLSLTVTNEVVAQADGLEVFILGGSTGQWTFSPMSANNTGKVIYAAGGSSSNYLRTDTLLSEDVGDKGRFTVEITEAGIAHITAIHATTTRNKLAYNDSNSIFSCYAGTPNNQGTPIGTIDLKIYRLIEANNFANVMLNSLATICDVEGVNTPLDSLKTAWKSFATSYASLSSFDKKTFKDGTGNFGGTKVEKAIALYDHIASIYNTRLESEGLDDYNFMSRSITPINNLAQPSNYVNTNASATAIIIIIAVVGTISLAGIFFIRRRKEDR